MVSAERGLVIRQKASLTFTGGIVEDDQVFNEIDLAGGYALAAIALSSALMTKLVVRGVFSPSDASETFDMALKAIDAGLVKAPDQAITLAQAALKGFAQTWSKHDKRN